MTTKRNDLDAVARGIADAAADIRRADLANVGPDAPATTSTPDTPAADTAATKRVVAYVTPAEHAALAARAKRARLSLSTWARLRLLDD